MFFQYYCQKRAVHTVLFLSLVFTCHFLFLLIYRSMTNKVFKIKKIKNGAKWILNTFLSPQECIVYFCLFHSFYGDIKTFLDKFSDSIIQKMSGGATV